MSERYIGWFERIGIDDVVPGYGRLLTLPAFAEAAAS